MVELREQLRAQEMGFSGAEKRLALLEWLLVTFSRTVADFLAPSRKREVGGGPAGKVTQAMLEAQAALDKVTAVIAAIEAKKADLKEKAAGGGVAGMRAKNELSQLLSQDPTELNKALLSAEAALRKAGGSANVPPGSLWWMNRELEELKKYRPGYKGPK